MSISTTETVLKNYYDQRNRIVKLISVEAGRSANYYRVIKPALSIDMSFTDLAEADAFYTLLLKMNYPNGISKNRRKNR